MELGIKQTHSLSLHNVSGPPVVRKSAGLSSWISVPSSLDLGENTQERTYQIALLHEVGLFFCYLLSFCVNSVSVCLSVSVSVCLCFRLSLLLSVSVCLGLSLSVSLSLTLDLSIYLFIYISIFLYIYMYASG